MPTPQTCNLEPFRYPSTPVTGSEQGASGDQINQQRLENYLSRLLSALCSDLQEINSRLDALESTP